MLRQNKRNTPCGKCNVIEEHKKVKLIFFLLFGEKKIVGREEDDVAHVVQTQERKREEIEGPIAL